MVELRECPFCGGEAEVTYDWYGESSGTQVECTKCGAFVDTPDEWNTRVNDGGFLPMTEENMREHGWVKLRKCHVVKEYVDLGGEYMTDYDCCLNQSGWGHNFCPNCGAEVER